MRSQDIEIPEPCHADWEQMRPEQRGRYCFECKTKAHDLSSMTETEARTFLQRTACEDVCVSYEHDERGRLVFREPRPAPIVPLHRLRRPRTAAAGVATVGLAAALAACAPHADPAARGPSSEAPRFAAPAVVIPHGEPLPVTERPPVTETTIDEPCDAPKVEVDTPRPRVRGRRPPIKKKMGKKPARRF